MNNYVTPGDVARVLELPPDAVLTAPASIGDHTVHYGAPPPPNPGQPSKLANLIPGALLTLGYLSATPEDAVVASATANTVTLSAPLGEAHGTGSRLIETTRLADPASAGSRMWDDITLGRPEWYFYEAGVVESTTVRANRDGILTVPVTKRPLVAITAVSYHLRGMSTDGTVNGGQWDATSEKGVYFDTARYPYVYEIDTLVGGTIPVCAFQEARVTTNYQAGFLCPGSVVPIGAIQPLPLPADISRSVAMLAARLWKEKDSGFSDAIAADSPGGAGKLLYLKEAPADVRAMAKSWRRTRWPS